jgi:hypothetical protein
MPRVAHVSLFHDTLLELGIFCLLGEEQKVEQRPTDQLSGLMETCSLDRLLGQLRARLARRLHVVLESIPRQIHEGVFVPALHYLRHEAQDGRRSKWIR